MNRSDDPAEHERENASPSVRPKSPPGPLRGIAVLVVDDNYDTRDMLKRLLTYSGGFVTTVASADAALAALRRVTPDVIVSDLAMPRHDGHWLLQRIRSRRSGLRNIPAIAITAYRETEPERKAYEAGFAAYLEKPLDFRRLIETIQQVVGRG